MSQFVKLSAPLGRVLISIIFLVAGINKISGYANTQGYMDAMGIPGILLPLVILLEVLGSILIIIGWKSRSVAFALAGFTLLSAFLFHSNFSDQSEFIMFMKNIAISGGFFFIIAHGPGAYALDNLTKKKN